jgi:hypothetical protein
VGCVLRISSVLKAAWILKKKERGVQVRNEESISLVSSFKEFHESKVINIRLKQVPLSVEPHQVPAYHLE